MPESSAADGESVQFATYGSCQRCRDHMASDRMEGQGLQGVNGGILARLGLAESCGRLQEPDNTLGCVKGVVK